MGGAVDKTGRDKIIRIAAFDVSKNERRLKLMCSCGVAFCFNGIVKQKQTILIGLCQQHDSDLSPTHVHILLQRQEGSIHQWSMLSKHTKGFISNLSVCVCVRVKQHQLFCSSVSHTPPFFCGIFMGDSGQLLAFTNTKWIRRLA